MVKLEKLIQEISKIDTNTKEKEIQSLIVKGKQLIPEIYGYVKSNGKYKKEAKTALKKLSEYLGYNKYKDMESSLKNNEFISIEAKKFSNFCININNFIEDLYFDRNEIIELDLYEIYSMGYFFKQSNKTFYLAKNEIINFLVEFLKKGIRDYELYILIYLINKDEKLLHESIEIVPNLIFAYREFREWDSISNEIIEFIIKMGKGVVPKLMDEYVSYDTDDQLYHQKAIAKILLKMTHEFRDEIKTSASNILIKDIIDDFRQDINETHFLRLDISKVLLTVDEFSGQVINYVLQIIKEAPNHLSQFGHGLYIDVVIVATEILREFIEKVESKTAIPILTKFLVDNRYRYVAESHSGNRIISFNIIDIILLLEWEDKTVIDAFYQIWLGLRTERKKGEKLKKHFESKIRKIINDNVKAYEIISELSEPAKRKTGLWPRFVEILIGGGITDLSCFDLIGELKQLIKLGDKQVKNKNIADGLDSFKEAFETLGRVQDEFGYDILDEEKEHIQMIIYNILFEKYSSLIEESKKFFSYEDFELADEILKEALDTSKQINYYCKDLEFVVGKKVRELEGKLYEIKNKDQIQKAKDEKKKQQEISPLIAEGTVLLKENQYEHALEIFEKALTIYPGHKKAIQGMNSASKMIIASQKIITLLQKFQPNLPVGLTRIAELSSLEKIEAEIIIKAILSQNKTIGKYFDLEQVFVKSEGIDQELSSIAERYEKLKHYTCFTCGFPLEKDVKTCSECKKEVPFCNVCKLPITFGDEIGKCSLCESTGHMTHLQEWIKTQGKCPTCLQKLPIEGIIPLSEVIKK